MGGHGNSIGIVGDGILAIPGKQTTPFFWICFPLPNPLLRISELGFRKWQQRAGREASDRMVVGGKGAGKMAMISSKDEAPPPPAHFPSLADPSATAFQVYYGTAASAANYGGNASKKDSAEYVYDIPAGWKERLVSKVEKGTNGTDSEFYNPKKKAEKECLTYLAGFRQLAPTDTVLSNLALSDVSLPDLIGSADSVSSEERKDEKGQVYYVYEIDGVGAHSLISVTCANNKLYAHFVNAPTPEWNRDGDLEAYSRVV
ncbi:thylakoid lumenal protein [Actinidia rufa]|uniref:Thylakoid lumenal protein n=1 Tax=Actinidia rufa TaxID=165716 RepID=A0A7J0F0Q7_9ERIC|nr:thylakoid lumenal protein [Actinidia rufa]